MTPTTTTKRDWSPIIVAVVLFVGVAAQAVAGPLAGLVGAAVAATAGGVAVHIHEAR